LCGGLRGGLRGIDRMDSNRVDVKGP